MNTIASLHSIPGTRASIPYLALPLTMSRLFDSFAALEILLRLLGLLLEAFHPPFAGLLLPLDPLFQFGIPLGRLDPIAHNAGQRLKLPRELGQNVVDRDSRAHDERAGACCCGHRAGTRQSVGAKAYGSTAEPFSSSSRPSLVPLPASEDKHSAGGLSNSSRV